MDRRGRPTARRRSAATSKSPHAASRQQKQNKKEMRYKTPYMTKMSLSSSLVIEGCPYPINAVQKSQHS